LSYTPARGTRKLKEVFGSVKFWFGILAVLEIRAADAKEVGVGNPAEETCCYPNDLNVTILQRFVNSLSSAASSLISGLYAADFSFKVRW